MTCLLLVAAALVAVLAVAPRVCRWVWVWAWGVAESGVIAARVVGRTGGRAVALHGDI
jgi:hypothetical protein